MGHWAPGAPSRSFEIAALPSNGSVEKKQSSFSVTEGWDWIQNWMVGFVKSGRFNRAWHLERRMLKSGGREEAGEWIENCF